ncbi:MAG: hypothetical protein AABW73_02930 [Nanoarchaeota archaeon]
MRDKIKKLKNTGLIGMLALAGCTTQGWGVGMNTFGVGLGGRTGAMYQAMGQGAIAIGNNERLSQSIENAGENIANRQSSQNSNLVGGEDEFYDTILIMKDGRRIKGYYDGENENLLSLMTWHGECAYSKNNIWKVVNDNKDSLGNDNDYDTVLIMKDGRRQTGYFTTEDEKLVNLKTWHGECSYSKNQIWKRIDTNKEKQSTDEKK